MLVHGGLAARQLKRRLPRGASGARVMKVLVGMLRHTRVVAFGIPVPRAPAWLLASVN
jgi:hypothetical protein